MKAKLRLLLAFPIFFFCFSVFPQDGLRLWEETADIGPTAASQLEAGKGFVLEEARLDQALDRIRQASGTRRLLYFPDASGEVIPYRVEERSVMAPELQARYPNIRSYVGYGVGQHEGKRIRFSWSHKGFQAMLSAPGETRTRFIEKVSGKEETYVLFDRDQKQDEAAAWKCATPTAMSKSDSGDPAAKLVDDQRLRRYRLAVATTGEYAQYHGGTVADALAAINATMTRVNEVFERDMAVQMELIGINDQVIYTDPATDPFGGNLNAEVQNTLDAVLGPGAYDIGHLFHRAGENGNAGGIGTVCENGIKGAAFAATPTPEGDRFDLDFVAHEMGHQFGANHTWSFDTEGTGVQAEPASGTTIMGYAGIATGNNVANQGDDYFHYFSIVQMTDYVVGLGCGTSLSLSNSPPVITPLQDYMIPKGTAFALEGIATDPDPADQLTYAWEQVDNGVVTTASFGPENPVGANFRSQRPTPEPVRYFPRLSRILSGDLTQTSPPTGSAWETVSEIQREMNFALTVRDNSSEGGQVASDVVKIGVLSAAGPFRMTSQQSAVVLDAGSVQTLTWDVAGTREGPINCQFIDVWFSSDGGATFPTLLASNVPNTGSAQIQMPASSTTQGRFMLKASDNVFLAVNEAVITIRELNFVLEGEGLTTASCQPADATYNFTYHRFGSFTEVVTLGIEDLPAGVSASFSSATVQADNTDLSLTLSNIAAAAPGSYPLVLTGTSASSSFALPIALEVVAGTPAPPILSSPTNGQSDVSLRPLLQWDAIPQAVSYTVEVASDPGFTNDLQQQTLSSTSYIPSLLDGETDYFWRVQATTACGLGAFSPTSTFRTIFSECRSLQATGLPLTIPATGTPTVTSSIFFGDDLPVVSARVSLDVAHSFLSDLIIKLQSPQGTVVTLISNSCGAANDLVATFDQGAPPFVCGNNPAISGTVRPLGSLSAFSGESSFGEWTLIIEDTQNQDGGALNAFSLELCVEGAFRPDADADGVFDDGDDLCLGTPPGDEVDANGCSVYRFAADQFDIELFTETCIGNNDGSVSIQAKETLDYTATLSGNGPDQQVNFTRTTSLTGLTPGAYQLCLTGTSGSIDFQPQCFDLNIAAPDPLSVQARLAADGSGVTLDLEGAEGYVVTLNGKQMESASRRAVLVFEEGLNIVEVAAIPACRGSFTQTYFYSSRPVVAPNPFSDRLEFYLPWPADQFEVQLFNAAGVRVLERRIQAADNSAVLNLPYLPPGLYVVLISSEGRNATYKVYRE